MNVAESFQCLEWKLLINTPVFNEVHSFIYSLIQQIFTK